MSTPTHSDAIEALFSEARRFPPPPEFAAQANAKPGIYEEADRDYEAWWKSWADKLEWMTPPTKRSSGTSRSRRGSPTASSTRR